jgi:hypothetical protein
MNKNVKKDAQGGVDFSHEPSERYKAIDYFFYVRTAQMTALPPPFTYPCRIPSQLLRFRAPFPVQQLQFYSMFRPWKTASGLMDQWFWSLLADAKKRREARGELAEGLADTALDIACVAQPKDLPDEVSLRVPRTWEPQWLSLHPDWDVHDSISGTR